MQKTFLITGGSGGIGAALAHKQEKLLNTPLVVYKSNRKKAVLKWSDKRL